MGGNGGWRGGIGLTSEPWKSQQRLLNQAQVPHPHLLTVISSKSLHLSKPPFSHLIKDKNHFVSFKWDIWPVMGYFEVLKIYLCLHLKTWKSLWNEGLIPRKGEFRPQSVTLGTGSSSKKPLPNSLRCLQPASPTHVSIFLLWGKGNPLYFLFGCTGSSLRTGFLSLRGAEASVRWGVQAYCKGFSHCRAWTLCVGSVVAVPRLSCSSRCGIFPDQGR